MKEKEKKEVAPQGERELDGQGAIFLLFVNVAAIAVGIVIGIILLSIS